MKTWEIPSSSSRDRTVTDVTPAAPPMSFSVTYYAMDGWGGCLACGTFRNSHLCPYCDLEQIPSLHMIDNPVLLAVFKATFFEHHGYGVELLPPISI